MPDDFFAMINDLSRHDDLDDWHRWHDQLVTNGFDLLEMVDALLASSTDEAIEQRLEHHRARVVSILALAQRPLSKVTAGCPTPPTSGKVVH